MNTEYVLFWIWSISHFGFLQTFIETGSLSVIKYSDIGLLWTIRCIPNDSTFRRGLYKWLDSITGPRIKTVSFEPLLAKLEAHVPLKLENPAKLILPDDWDIRKVPKHCVWEIQTKILGNVQSNSHRTLGNVQSNSHRTLGNVQSNCHIYSNTPLPETFRISTFFADLRRTKYEVRQ